MTAIPVKGRHAGADTVTLTCRVPEFRELTEDRNGGGAELLRP